MSNLGDSPISDLTKARAKSRNRPSAPLTWQRLHELLSYDPQSGIFVWKVTGYRIQAGQVAGSPHKKGYVSIMLEQRNYLAHRLAWLYMTQEWPAETIDHRNRIRTDNTWANLRPASYSQNNANTGLKSINTSGAKGVSWDRNRGKWKAQITISGRNCFLGRFNSIDEAAEAYQMKASLLWGDFACAARI